MFNQISSSNLEQTMDFNALIRALGQRIQQLKTQVILAEDARDVFILPFIKELGYNVSDPMEVITDARLKKGMDCGYTIMNDGAPLIRIECKPGALPSEAIPSAQLTTSTLFLIHTNGRAYQLYTNLFTPACRNEKPFLSFDITDISDSQLEILKKFHKSCFDLDHIIDIAGSQIYTNAVMELVHKELRNPSMELAMHFAHQVYPGAITHKELGQCTALIRKSFREYISDLVDAQLQATLRRENKAESRLNHEDNRYYVTSEKLECFTIVRSVLRQTVPVERITCQDTPSYLAILLDNMDHKIICRLYLNNSIKYLGLFDDQKKEIKIELLSLNDLYLYGNTLLKTLVRLDNRSVSTKEMLN